MVLTKCQKKAQKALNSFILNKDERHFILSGNAGTGKTYLVANILLNKIHYLFKDIYVLAPTQKALAVIKEKVIEGVEDGTLVSNYYSKIKFRTVCSFLSKKARYTSNGDLIDYVPKGLDVIVHPITKEKYYAPESKDITIDNVDFEKLKENRWFYCGQGMNISEVSYEELIIIDEVSMINKEDHQFLIRGHPNSKILFLGDKLQLPPIVKNCDEEKDVDIKYEDEISDVFKMNYNSINMTTIKRTKKQSIGEIYELTRNNVISTKRTHEYIFNELEKLNLLCDEEYIKKQIEKDILNDTDFCVLSYTGVEKNRYNVIIQDCLDKFKTKKFGYYIDVEYVSDVNYNKQIKNNTTFRITDVRQDIIRVMGNFQVKCYLLITNKETNIIVIKEEDIDKFNKWFKCCKEILKEDLKGKKGDKKKELVKELVNLKLTSSYKDINEQATATLNTLRIKFMNETSERFGISSCMTVHKSQGSSIKKCYINLLNMYFYGFSTNGFRNARTNIKNKMKAKLLYVATTRATDRIEYF